MKKDIQKLLLPIHPLSNVTIETYFKKNKINGLVRSRDQMPIKIKPNSCIIINLDPSGGQGTHWVCAVNSKYEDSILYYDSYGLHLPPQDFLDMKHDKDIVGNNTQHQKEISVNCGYYCLKVCKSILKDRMTYQECMEQFRDYPGDFNDDIADNL